MSAKEWKINLFKQAVSTSLRDNNNSIFLQITQCNCPSVNIFKTLNLTTLTLLETKNSKIIYFKSNRVYIVMII